ncbi:MAG: Glutamyl-tRNA amidotransferase [Pseudomonas sp.]|nr:Glutamyl-tRNA amidotransferase [Pseudomonas sp.]
MSGWVIQGVLGAAGPTVAIKDTIDVAGWPTQAGSRAFEHCAPASAHADVVQAMLSKGWQVIGKTVLHELAFGVTGVNDWAGTPVNPMAPNRIVGGSSSGSAAVVAEGCVDVALGTDTGGSIRMPAACCGIFGLKPTFARLSRKGVQPLETSLDCVGPMAREIKDIVAAMVAIDDTFTSEMPREHYCVGVVQVDCQPEIQAALDAALSLSGWTTQPVHLADLQAAFEAGLTVINAETWTAFGQYTGKGLLGADVEARLGRAAATNAVQLASAERIRSAFTAEVDTLLQKFDAIVLPSLPRLPPLLDDVLGGAPVLDLTRFLRPFNLNGHPALTVPVPCVDEPIMAGMQLIGRKGDDALLCAMATGFSARR